MFARCSIKRSGLTHTEMPPQVLRLGQQQMALAPVCIAYA